MNHDRRGSGSPIVLLHGIGSRWQVWSPVLDRLAARHEVIALDLPGFGASAADGGSGTVEHLADRVASFLSDRELERPVVGGSSLGGAVALELGRRGVARSVVAFSPVGFFGNVGAAWCRTVVNAARAGGATLSPALPRLFATRSGRIVLCGVFYGHPASLDPGDCLADVRALVAAPGFATARRRLGEWRMTEPMPDVPVTIAWGDRDLVLPYRQAARARRVLPHARHVRLAGCGHLPFADDPETCARLLLEAA
ncbi:alpha/beta fold hydrolase [Paractinoplanes globisporus]|uniref:Alpha/beta fold hydrolase n=1 Tax=Paractinoplanes globisporus TaxID=113565 RepID=A0ABW6WVN0_9ACTN|nr:alpha/beta fold hydrolase [Actinoplanes globisporus]